MLHLGPCTRVWPVTSNPCSHLGLQLLNLVLQLADVLRRIRVVQLALNTALLPLPVRPEYWRSEHGQPKGTTLLSAPAAHLDLQLCDALPHLRHCGHAVSLPKAHRHHFLLALKWGEGSVQTLG